MCSIVRCLSRGWQARRESQVGEQNYVTTLHTKPYNNKRFFILINLHERLQIVMIMLRADAGQ